MLRKAIHRTRAIRRVETTDGSLAVLNLAEVPVTPAKVPRLEASAIDRLALIPALAGYPTGAARSLLRGCAFPQTELDRLTIDTIGLDVIVGGTALTTEPTLLAHCLLAFEQPRNRTKGRQVLAAEPQCGQLEDGTTHFRFAHPEHMRDVQRDVIARSLPGALARGRHLEILETGVRRNLVVELAYITFDDGTEPQWILNVRDGISRWATMMAATLGLIAGAAFEPARNPARRTFTPPPDGENGASVAQTIADVVVPAAKLSAARSSKALVMLGLKRHEALVADYTANTFNSVNPVLTSAGTSGTANADTTDTIDSATPALSADTTVGNAVGISHDQPTENAWALVLRQFSTAPATVVLRALSEGHLLVPVREAAESFVADLHTGVDTWVDDDRRLFDSKRAVRAMWADGHLGDDEARLWLGQRPATDVDVVFPSAHGPDPARAGLRFLTQFYARMLGPDLFEIVKTYLRTRVGERYSFARTADVLAPMANQHWDHTKPLSRLWSYQGGPLIEETLRVTGLVASMPADYRTLVPLAMAGDLGARTELVLAGGSALMADNIITTTLIGGSGSATQRLPFRGSAREIFELFSMTREGLETLALAANQFDPDARTPDVRHRVVNLDADDAIARDPSGVPLRLFERDVAALLAATKARRAEIGTWDADNPAEADALAGGSCTGADRRISNAAPDEQDARATDEAHLTRQLDSLPGLVARVEQAAAEALAARKRLGSSDIGLSEESAEALAEKLARTSMAIARLTR